MTKQLPLRLDDSVAEGEAVIAAASRASVDPADAGAAARRSLLAGAGAAVLLTATIPTVAEAALPTPRPYRATLIPTSRELHLMKRFSFGYSSTLRQQVAAAGGARSWFNQQLNPAGVPDSFADGIRSWFPLLGSSPLTSLTNQRSGRFDRNQYTWAIARWSMLRQVYSNRQVHEVMADFWLNHFHVFAQSSAAWMFRPSYDAAIRKLALGTFEQLLKAAETHPAMLRYLDQDESIGTRLNENLGRELLELHTVGAGSGYTEAMVKDSARILTGQLVDRDTLQPYYSEADHYHGRVTVLGFTHANTYGQGRAVIDAYLSYLAHHPATARRLARKLAVRFVADNPPAALVERVAQAYLRSGTDIKTTLRALVDDPEFYSGARPKVRTATEDVVASLRAIGARISAPTDPKSGSEAAHAILWLSSGICQRPWHWVTPDGFPDRSDAWASASRMLASFRVHHNLAGGYYPKTHIGYRLGAAWLPQRRIRFDQLVDHLCRTLHGRGSTAEILGAACTYLGVRPGTVVTATHAVARYKMVWLVALLLDSPTHMTR